MSTDRIAACSRTIGKSCFTPRKTPTVNRCSVIAGWSRRNTSSKPKSSLARLEERGLCGTSPIIFYSEAPKAQINYAETGQLEGKFITDQELNETKAAWELREDRLKYLYRPIPTSFGGLIRLRKMEAT